MKLEFFRQIFAKTQISRFIKIRPMGAEFFHADRQTDVTKLIVAFRILQARLKTDKPKHILLSHEQK
jgi:hypothetical protein